MYFCCCFCRVTQTRAFDTEPASSSYASGFIVDRARGIILTNRHVVTPGGGCVSGLCQWGQQQQQQCSSSSASSSSASSKDTPHSRRATAATVSAAAAAATSYTVYQQQHQQTCGNIKWGRLSNSNGSSRAVAAVAEVAALPAAAAKSPGSCV